MTTPTATTPDRPALTLSPRSAVIGGTGALLLLTMRFARNGLLALGWEQLRRVPPARLAVR